MESRQNRLWRPFMNSNCWNEADYACAESTCTSDVEMRQMKYSLQLPSNLTYTCITLDNSNRFSSPIGVRNIDIDLYNASVNSKHQHPPWVTPGVLHSTSAPGPGFILDDLPWGPGFCISIKLHLVQ